VGAAQRLAVGQVEGSATVLQLDDVVGEEPGAGPAAAWPLAPAASLPDGLCRATRGWWRNGTYG
jgi:hypothetical protein